MKKMKIRILGFVQRPVMVVMILLSLFLLACGNDEGGNGDNRYRRSTSIDRGTTNIVTYDVNGRLSGSTHGVTYTYYPNGRLNSSTIPDGADTFTFTWTYDADGRLSSSTQEGSVTTTYTYDANGRLSGSTNGTNTTAYVYDADGRLLSSTSDDSDRSTTTYTYDADGRLTERESSFTDSSTSPPTTIIDSTSSYSYEQGLCIEPFHELITTDPSQQYCYD